MRDVLAALCRPAYTGEYRCWPCTALNVGLISLLALAVVVAGLPSLALGVLLVGFTAIALRGYVVPYTPRFAPRLATRLPGELFDAGTNHRPPTPDAPAVTDSLSDDRPDGGRVLDTLIETGVLLTEDESLYLDQRVRADWRAEMDTLRAADPETLAAATLDATPAAVESEYLVADGFEWVVLTDEHGTSGAGTWLTRPVAIAETAAVYTLADDLPAELRVAAARPLRMFLETCPACGGTVEKTTSAACCGGPGPSGPDDVLACLDCEARLFTFPD